MKTQVKDNLEIVTKADKYNSKMQFIRNDSNDEVKLHCTDEFQGVIQSNWSDDGVKIGRAR